LAQRTAALAANNTPPPPPYIAPNVSFAAAGGSNGLSYAAKVGLGVGLGLGGALLLVALAVWIAMRRRRQRRRRARRGGGGGGERKSAGGAFSFSEPVVIDLQDTSRSTGPRFEGEESEAPPAIGARRVGAPPVWNRGGPISL